MTEHPLEPSTPGSQIKKFRLTTMRRSLPHRVKQIAQYTLLILSLGFIGIALWRGSKELRTLNWQIFLSAGLVSFFLYPVSLLLQALLWTAIVNQQAQNSPSWQDIKIFCQAHLARRIPGTVWYLANRTLSYQDRGIVPTTTLISSALEWTCQLWAAALVYTSVSHNVTLIIGSYGLSAAALTTWAALKKAYGSDGILKSKHLPNGLDTVLSLPGPRTILLWFVAYSVCWVIAGTILHLLVTTVVTPSGYPQLHWTTSIGISTLSNGFSLLMSFTGGWGAREVALTLLLRPYMPISLGASVAVFLRILYVAGDLVWAGSLWLLSHYLANRATRKQP